MMNLKQQQNLDTAAKSEFRIPVDFDGRRKLNQFDHFNFVIPRKAKMFKTLPLVTKRTSFAQLQALQRTTVESKRWNAQAQEFRPSSQQYPKVNVPYEPANVEMPQFIPKDNSSNTNYSSIHNSNEPWDHETVVDVLEKNSLFTWGAKNPMYACFVCFCYFVLLA